MCTAGHRSAVHIVTSGVGWCTMGGSREVVMARPIRIRRVYQEAEPDEGARVLVDGVWPRGVRKEELELDEWRKDVAPSTALRTWFGHDPAKFEEFRRRYTDEL